MRPPRLDFSRRSFLRRIGVGASVGLAGCVDSLLRRDPPATPTESEIPRPDDAGYTYTHVTGNRYLDGRGDLDVVEPVDVEVPGTPVWVAGTRPYFGTAEADTQWAVVLDDGSVHGFFAAADGDVTSASIGPDRIDGPPVISSEAPRVLTHPESSPDTHPFPLGDRLVTIDEAGTVTVHPNPEDETHERRTFEIDALPDARIVAKGRSLYVFADATTEYDHDVLGDSLEAGSIAVIDTDDWSVSRLSPPEGTVFEGIAPIVTSLERTDSTHAIATASDAQVGARVVAIDVETGETLSGAPIGSGFRWRHPIAVEDFGPGDTQEIAAVRTPHIGGVAEFYRPTEGRLELVATDEGDYSSHVLGSRNLDGGLAGKFAGFNQEVLALPTSDRTEIALLRRVEDGVRQNATLAVGGELTTNLAGANKSYTVAAGRDGSVRFWIG
ncbi:hypothetical protein [Haloferax sp. DFSO60]|uniref:hypothetical protein n=1 Tax=Haloferax sp. DFSO60 TaxID=3388652 RepID=UPI00397DB1E2